MTDRAPQRFLVVNAAAYEYLDPEAFGDGPGLLEFGASGSGTMLGLALVLAVGCDGRPKEFSAGPRVGSWAGDPILIVGDAAEVPSLYARARETFVNISADVIAILALEPYERRALESRGVLQREPPPDEEDRLP